MGAHLALATDWPEMDREAQLPQWQLWLAMFRYPVMPAMILFIVYGTRVPGYRGLVFRVLSIDIGIEF